MQNEDAYELNQNLKLLSNSSSKEIREGCIQMLEHVRETKWPKKFKESLIDWCIWQYTTCEFIFSRQRTRSEKAEDNFRWGDKYASRFYSDKAWEEICKAKNYSQISRSLRFDHVWERKKLRDKILGEGFKRTMAEHFVCCVVLNDDEHGKIHGRKGDGWERYESMMVWELRDGKKFKNRVDNGKLKQIPI